MLTDSEMSSTESDVSVLDFEETELKLALPGGSSRRSFLSGDDLSPESERDSPVIQSRTGEFLLDRGVPSPVDSSRRRRLPLAAATTSSSLRRSSSDGDLGCRRRTRLPDLWRIWPSSSSSFSSWKIQWALDLFVAGISLMIFFVVFTFTASLLCLAAFVHNFQSMEADYGVETKIEHLGCMVDLLGKSGRLSEAVAMIGATRWQADVVILGALLTSCKSHGDVQTAEKVALGMLACKAGAAAALRQSSRYRRASSFYYGSPVGSRQRGRRRVAELRPGVHPGLRLIS